ncbi:MAG: hypothetical protein HUU48_04430 [Flavobacteriales bacterium]|nr:hypothetical protein [Flavobacteriales bacterium]
MENLLDITSKLKDKILILIEAHNRQKQITYSKEQEIKALEQKIENLNLQLKQQKENYELKITEGAEKNKSSENAKMLIEQLVAEVDACIEMLEK